MTGVSVVLLVHVAAAVFMAGLIWFVQVVHYPMFASVGREKFSDYEVEHTTRTGWIVGPVMLVEAVTGLVLLFEPQEGIAGLLFLASIVLLAVIWLSTALLQIPLHRRLSIGFDERVHRSLVSTNRIRTFGWSVRAILLLVVVLLITS